MTKPAAFLATVAAIFAFGVATASNASVAKPPATYQGQWWTNALGCEYSRAGRPGETMWFLIVNTAKKGCPTYITGKSWGGVYKENGPKIGG
jgi:hypothetical protein